jgi:hypothetical protein
MICVAQPRGSLLCAAVAHSGSDIWQKATSLKVMPLSTYLDEDDEVLEAGVEVCLLPQAADLLEVAVVDVCIHPEHALEDGAHHVHEVGREGLPELAWKHRGVINLLSQHRPEDRGWGFGGVCRQAYISSDRQAGGCTYSVEGDVMMPQGHQVMSKKW